MTDYLLLFIVVGVTISICVEIMLRLRRKQLRVDHILAQEANKRSGTAEKEFGMAYLALNFLHRGTKIIVRTLPKKLKTSQRVQIRADMINHRLCMIGFYENKFFSKTILKGFNRVKIQEPRFDNKIIMKTDDEYFAQKIVGASLVNKLLRFEMFPLEFKFTNNHFTATIYQIPTNENEYDQIIDLSLMFCDRLRELKDTEGLV